MVRTNPSVAKSLDETLSARLCRVASAEIRSRRAEPCHATQLVRIRASEFLMRTTYPSPGRGSPTVMFPTRNLLTVTPANVTSSRTKNGVS